MRRRRALQFEICCGFALGLAQAFCLAQATPAPSGAREEALALEQQGSNAEAEVQWRAILKAHPGGAAEAYAHLGLLEARQEHYPEAVGFYRKALAINPAVPGLRLNLGLALFKSGELRKAIVEFEPLVRKQAANAAPSPQMQQVSILLGMAHYGLGEYAAAARYLKEAAVRDPQNLQLKLALAHSYLWSKQYQSVLDVFHEILQLNAESAEADMLAGEALDEMKDSAGATEQFRAAVKADPNQPDAHFGLGYLLWTQRVYPEAVTEFQAELALNPKHAQALLYLGDAQMQLNHPELALPPLEKAKQIAPELSLARLDLGVLYADAGREEQALAEMKEAVRLSPDDANGHWHLGRLYRSMGKKDEAKAEFDKASSIHKAANDDLKEKMSGGQKPPLALPSK